MSRSFLCLASCLVLLLLSGAPASRATGPSQAGLSGIWRLDDRASDTPAAIEALLRREAMHEQAPQAGQPASPGGGSGNAPSRKGRGGGMGGGLGGRGGGMAGGHHGGRRGGGERASGGDAPAAPARYSTPPWLADDSVLIVQEDSAALQVRLDSGTQLDLRFGHPAQQGLNGSALVRSFRDDGGMHVEIRFADGSLLTQDWSLGADGRQLVLREHWLLSSLERPVDFVRVYQRLG